MTRTKVKSSRENNFPRFYFIFLIKMFFMRKCLIYTVNISIRMTERIVQIRILILMFNVFFIIAPLLKKKRPLRKRKKKRSREMKHFSHIFHSGTRAHRKMQSDVRNKCSHIQGSCPRLWKICIFTSPHALATTSC